MPLSWEAHENPLNFRRAQGICAKASVSFPKLHTNFSMFLVGHWLPGRGWREHRQYWQLRGKVVPESICSSTCPSSPCALREALDHQCTSPSPLSAGWMHVGIIPNSCLVPHAKSRTRGIQAAFECLAESWLHCWLFTQSVICSFCTSSDADNLCLYHWHDIVILGMLMRSDQNTVQCTASAR